jgi:hypothetical protein
MVNCYFLKKQIAQRRLKKEKNTTKLVWIDWLKDAPAVVA